MDWNSLKDQVSNLSLYDVKASIRKVQNAVMNYTEMEAKVREATNNEPWGASSTLMQEIAAGTHNYQLLNEIMPMIYKRFTEKSAEEWRQIYKALQLMEFLVKNGSERVIDDARSHLSLLKMLRQFHYIDQNGKDQGLNVRNRSKELTDLLGDVDRIRAERKKARTTRNKYSGVEGGAGLGASSFGGSGSRYGGFEGGSGVSSSTFGGSTRGVYGDGGGFGGESHDDYDEGGRTAGTDRFDEYDEFDDGGAQAAPGRRKADASSASKRAVTSPKKAEAPKPKAPEVDLFDFGDDEPASAPVAHQTFSAPAPVAASSNNDDDDFDDFQSAAPAAAAPVAAAPAALPKPNYSSFSTPLSAATPTSGFSSPAPNYSSSAFSSPPQAQPTQAAFSNAVPKPAGYQPSGPNYFTSVSAATPAASASSAPSAQGSSAFASLGAPSSTAAKKPASGDAFASLLSGAKKPSGAGGAGKGLTMADLAMQKTQAGLYGAPAAGSNGFAASASGTQKPSTGSSGLDDLLG